MSLSITGIDNAERLADNVCFDMLIGTSAIVSQVWDCVCVCVKHRTCDRLGGSSKSEVLVNMQPQGGVHLLSITN